MKDFDGSRGQPSCQLSHDLVNQLTVIAIYCDLLNEDAPLDPETHRRLHAIRAAAKTLADQLSQHQCDSEGVLSVRPLSEPLPS